MKRFVKIGLAVVIGLPIVAATAIALLVDANTFRPIIEKQLTSSLNRKVTLGDLHLSLFTGSLVASDLSIAEDPEYGSQPFFVTKQLRIGVEMRPLIMSRQLIVRSFEADNSDIHLIRTSDGIWNFSSMSHEAKQDPAKKDAIPDLTVGEITIKDGRATIENLRAPGQPPTYNHLQVYDHLNVAIQQFSLTKSFPFVISAALAGDGTVDITGTTGPLNKQDAANTPFDAQISIKHLDPVVAGYVDPNTGIAFLGDLSAHVVADGTTVTTDGKIHADKLILLKGGRPTPQPIDISFNLVHSLQNNNGTVKDLALQTGKVAIHINGTYEVAGNDTWVNLKLGANRLSIDELQALIQAVGIKLPKGSTLKGGTLTTNLNITGTQTNNVISGPIQLDDTQLVGFDLGSKLAGVAAMTKLKTGDILAIKTMRANIRLSKAGVEAKDVYENMPAVGESYGSGTVAPNGDMNFRMVAKVNTAKGLGKVGVDLITKLNGTAGGGAKTVATTGVPIIITGKADNPVITADISGVVKGNATSVFNKVFGKKQPPTQAAH